MNNNLEYVEEREPKSFKTADEAIKYAESAYYVDPIHLEDQDEYETFADVMRTADLGQSGQIHYVRK